MSRRLPRSRPSGGRRRAPVSRPSRRLPWWGAALALVLALVLIGGVVGAVLAGGDGEDTPEVATSPSAAPSEEADGALAATTEDATEGATEGATEEAPRPPRVRECFDLTYEQAVAAVSDVEPVSCEATHTARTYFVGDLPTLVDGHLVAVDSERARRAPARECPERVGEFLGGTPDDLRLSMLRPVWFSPSVAESDRGANWYRCDVVVVAAAEELAPLTGRLQGVLGRELGSQVYGMCGTAEPGTTDFERVACLRPHSWRAVEVVEIPDGDYPGVASVRAAGQDRCEDTGRARASDPLSFQWGYEWPTREQWRSGVTWGLCWVPNSA